MFKNEDEHNKIRGKRLVLFLKCCSWTHGEYKIFETISRLFFLNFTVYNACFTIQIIMLCIY